MGATVTSFYFLCFLLGVIAIYYIVPHKFQWVILLLSSIAYYLLSGNGVLIVYPFISCIIAYFGTRYMVAISGDSTAQNPKKKRCLIVTILLMLSPLLALKYINLIINTYNGITHEITYRYGTQFVILERTPWLVPLGISFYTFTMLGYVIDVYNGIADVQRNPFKLITFGIYFPTVLSGPIMKYREDGNQFFACHRFDYRNITFGAQRILWGMFKTLVISERMRVVADYVYDKAWNYEGPLVIVATFSYAFELYTNFSGCMDIVLGISEMLGLKLPENFETPFFAKSISEYWRRWHITLGIWMKEYVFYPLLRSRLIVSIQNQNKKLFGKKKGKQITTFITMLVLWFTVGVWHGGEWKYIIGSGLLHWMYIVFEELIAPVAEKLFIKCHINPKAKILELFRMIRTFILVCIGFIYFRSINCEAAGLFIGKKMFVKGCFKAFIDGSIFETGLDYIELTIALVSIVILFTVSLYQYKYGSVRERISKMKLPVRWIIWYALLFYTILLGFYGPGYSAAEFIYQGF